MAFNLDTTRFRPLALCLQPGGLPRELAESGVATWVLRFDRLRQLHRFAWVVIRVVWLVRAEHVDIIHLNGSTTVIAAGIAGRISHTPVVWHSYDPQTTEGLGRKLFVQGLRLINPAWIIFASEEARTTVADCALDLPRSTVIHPGVPTWIAPVVAGRSHPAVRALGSGPILAMFARMIPGKGHEDLLRAVALLRPRNPMLKVALLGGLELDGFTTTLQTLTDELGLSEIVWFAGYVSRELRNAVLDAATMVVHPATVEPFGLAVLEAMSAGKPVVVTDASGPSSIVVHGVSGLVCPRRDPVSLAHAIEVLLKDPELADRLGEAAQRRAEEFSVWAMVEAVERVWSQVAGLARVS